MKTTRVQRHLGLFIATFLLALPAAAQVAPSLGSEAPFGIVSSTFTNTSAGTTVNGNVCFTTGPAVSASVTGTTGSCPVAAGPDQLAALAVINSQPCTPLPAGPLESVVIGTNPPGVIPPGCYFRAGAIDIVANGTVTLNGNGVFIFRTNGAVTTGANSRFVLAGGACAGNVFFAPVGATTLGANSTFVGNILDAAGITLGNNSSLTGRALAFGGTVTTDASAITVPTACAAVLAPTVTVAKVSTGGTGSFNFSGTNGFPARTLSTATAGVTVTDTPQTLAAAGVATSITEAVTAGFTLNSIACTGLGGGGTATPNLATRTVVLDAAATNGGATITCTFNNASTTANPTLRLSKVSTGGTGTFSFTGTNGIAPQTVSTVTPGVAVSGASQTLAASGVATTITEAFAPGFSLASVACTGLGAGGTATPNLAARTLTLDAAATTGGVAIVCTFTNALLPPGSGETGIPTMSEWAMLMMTALLALAGFGALRKRRR